VKGTRDESPVATPESLTGKVSDWLEASGFALEMRVAREFEKAGFDVSQSSPYNDPITGKLRESDVVARHFSDIDETPVVIRVFAECKSSIKRPWVLLTTETGMGSVAWIAHTPTTLLADRLFLRFLKSNGKFESIPTFIVPKRLGYHFVSGRFDKASADPDDDSDKAHKAVVQVTHATRQWIESEHGERPQGEASCAIGLPLIVVGQDLFEGYLSAGGDIQAERVSEGLLSAQAEGFRDPVFVSVVTAAGLSEWVRRASATANRLSEIAGKLLPGIKRSQSDE
jgi:hypothetical protein